MPAQAGTLTEAQIHLLARLRLEPVDKPATRRPLTETRRAS